MHRGQAAGSVHLAALVDTATFAGVAGMGGTTGPAADPIPADEPPAVGPGSESTEHESDQLVWLRANAETLARLLAGLRR